MYPFETEISGLSIAWGRAKWDELEDGSSGYVFDDVDSYQVRVNPQQMADMGVSEEDMFDCIDQIEERLGSPENHRLAMGLFPKSGYSNAGIMVTSRSNGSVSCVFTPTSDAYESTDGYFEWYYKKPSMIGYGGLNDFLQTFDKITGGRESNILSSPVVPGYGEACEMTAGLMEDADRERLLQNVWNYHKNVSKGYKHRLEQEIFAELNKLEEVKKKESKP